MTLTLNLRPELEAQVQQEAAKEGVAPEEFIVQTLEQRIQIARNQAAIHVLESFYDGDEEEQRETLAFLRKSLDEDRLSDRKLFA